MKLPKQATDERRIVLLDTATQVARTIATILDPEQLLQRTVDTICSAFGFYYAGVFLVDGGSFTGGDYAAGDWAILRAGYGTPGAVMRAEGHRLKVGGNSMIGSCIAQHRAKIALDVGAEAVRFQNPHLPYTRSEMALPLIVGDEAIGALTVQSEEEAAFTQEDISILQSMADQLAVAIKNSTLHRQNQVLLRQTERRALLLQAAHEVGRQVTSILDLDELLPKTVDIICDAYGFYYAGVFLVEEGEEWAVLRAARGEAGAAMIAEGHKLKIGGYSMIGAAIYLREARIALDVGAEAVHFKNPHLPNTHSEMALPLVSGNNVLGAVTVQSVEERAFSSDDITALQTMADQLAIAIRNAQLLKELKRAHAELLRTKTYEALATATTEAVHWIGNKALPITTTVARMEKDLQAGEIDTASLLEDLGLVAESARQIVEVKENLLGATRDQQPRPVLLADLWQAAAHERKVPAGMLTIKGEPAAALAMGDSTQLVRIFGNLLQNALEANAKQISVEMSPAEASGFTVMRLEDDGEGIPIENQDKIWASFFTTKGASHQGLGLAACLHVISQLEGRIILDSQPGQGTNITILLPASQEPVHKVDFSSLSHSILLIDDNDVWANFVTSTLTNAGHTVLRRAAAQGSTDFDLILVDEAIESVPVLEVLQDLKDVGVAGKVLVVSSGLKVENVTAYLQFGIRDAVLKPYTPQELADLVM